MKNQLLARFLAERRCNTVSQFVHDNAPGDWSNERILRETAAMERILEQEAESQEDTTDEEFSGFVYGVIEHMGASGPTPLEGEVVVVLTTAEAARLVKIAEMDHEVRVEGREVIAGAIRKLRAATGT